MSNFEAFATAFLNRTAETIDKRTEKADVYEDEMRANRERNIQALQKRKNIADQAGSLAAQATDLGATEEMIRAAVASGPTGLVDLHRSLRAAEAKFGKDDVRANASAYVDFYIDPTKTFIEGEGALTRDEFIRQSYGLSESTPGSYEVEKGSFWDRALGRNAMDRRRAKLDQEVVVDGYSMYDLDSLAKEEAYKSLAPGSYANYTTPRIFTVENINDETLEMRRQVEAINATDEMVAADEGLKEAQKKLITAQNMGEETVGRDKAIAEAQAEVERYSVLKRSIMANGVGDIISQKMGYYDGGSYMERMGQTIDNLTGIPGFAESFMEMDVVEQPEDTATDTATDDSITVTELPAANNATDISGSNFRITEESEEAQSVPALNGASVTTVKAADGSERVRLIDDAVLPKGTIPAGTILTEAQSKEIINQLAVAVEGSVDLDPSINDASTGPVDTPVVGPAAAPGALADYDPQTDALLKRGADDMVAYIKSEGVDSQTTDEEIIQLLSEWAVTNNETLPMDKEMLVEAIRYGLDLKRPLQEPDAEQRSYIPTNMGPTELNTPKVKASLVEKPVKTSKGSKGRKERRYKPTNMGPTELNNPKVR